MLCRLSEESNMFCLPLGIGEFLTPGHEFLNQAPPRRTARKEKKKHERRRLVAVALGWRRDKTDAYSASRSSMVCIPPCGIHRAICFLRCICTRSRWERHGAVRRRGFEEISNRGRGSRRYLASSEIIMIRSSESHVSYILLRSVEVREEGFP